MPHDPGTVVSILGAGSALLSLFAMARVACIDNRCLEIDPVWAALAGWAGLGAIVVLEDPAAWPADVARGLVVGGAMLLVARLRPGWCGKADAGLFALVGVLSGMEGLLLALTLAMAFCVVTCIAYGLARGKGRRLHRHMFPWGPSCMAALGPMFACRVGTGIRPETVPPVTDGVVFIALAGTGFLSAGLIAGALPMAVRRRAAASAAALNGHGGRIHQSQHRKET